MSSQASDPAVPRLARGRFVVAARIARGPLSSTFRVQDQQARTTRALKLLSPELVTTDEARRFVEGGRWAATLDHPHVVAAFDSGEARKIPYLVLEHTGGGTIADWIARHGPMPPRTAALVVVQLVDALTAVHGIGVVHNQVSPGALLVDPNGLVKLGELDLATAEGARVGKLAASPFSAPDDGPADPRSDLYSVGMTLWALLRGQIPDGAPDPSVVADDAPHLEPVVRRCLAALPHRYPSIAALADDLLQALSDMPEEGDIALVVPARETPVDRDTPDLAPAVDPIVDPHHPLHRSAADEDGDRPDWLASEPSEGSPSGPPPGGPAHLATDSTPAAVPAPDEVIIGADVPVAQGAPAAAEPASVVFEDDLGSEPRPTPKPPPPPPRPSPAPTAPTAAPVVVPAAVPGVAPVAEPAAPAVAPSRSDGGASPPWDPSSAASATLPSERARAPDPDRAPASGLRDPLTEPDTPAPIPHRAEPVPVAPAAAAPVKRPEPKRPEPKVVTPSTSAEPESEGATPLWLKLLVVPLLGGIGLVIVLALAVTIFVGSGSLALSTARNQTAASQEQLYRVIDDERSLVERLGAKGADVALLEQAYLNYMEQRQEPHRLDAALEFAALVEAQAARAATGEVGPEQLALTNSLRKLRVARTHYEESLQAWHDAAESTRGQVVLGIGMGAEPPDR